MSDTSMGKRIRAARRRLGLSQEALGAGVGVTKGAVSQWESGRTRTITAPTMQRLEAVLGVPASWLMGGDDVGHRVEDVRAHYVPADDPVVKAAIRLLEEMMHDTRYRGALLQALRRATKG